MHVMSNENTQQETYQITVEPSNKYDKLLLGRILSYAGILILLVLQNFMGVHVPDSIYWSLGGSTAGLELGQLINVIKRK